MLLGGSAMGAQPGLDVLQYPQALLQTWPENRKETLVFARPFCGVCAALEGAITLP